MRTPSRVPCRLLATGLTGVLLAGVASATDPSDWPCWRGPDRTGVSPESGWASAGAAEPLWQAEVGLGYSSPTVVGDRLYTRGFFGEDGDDAGVDLTSCLDAATGEELWVHEVPAELWDNMHGGGTLSTPVVDGDAVYVLSRMGTLTALEAASGTVRWERDLRADFGVGLGPFGLSSSPVLLEGRVYVSAGKTVAFEAATGKTLWATDDYGDSYSTPAPFAWKGKDLLAVFNGVGLVVIERGEGKELARFPWTSEYNVNSATPVVIGNRLFISTGYNDIGCALVELTDEGLQQVWTNREMNSKMNGCVLLGEHLYGFDDAKLKCLDLEGNVLWTERGLGKGTLIGSDGRLIVLSEKGELLIAPADPEGFAPTYRAQVLEDGVCWTTPVLADGRIYCRNSLGQLVARDHRARAGE